MSTHGDGGKGSGRRKEDNDAFQNGWDRIFKRTKQEEQQPMIDEHEHEEDDSEWTCDVCGGPMYRQAHWGYAKCDDCGAKHELIDDDYV